MVHRDDPPLVKPLPRRRDNPWLRRLLVFATVVVLVDALFGERGLAETMRARAQYARATVTLAEIRAANDRLRARVRDLRHEAREIEVEARKEFGLVRPGEVLFVVRTP